MVSKVLGPKVLLVERNRQLLKILKPCFLSHHIRLTRIKKLDEISSVLNEKFSLLLIDVNLSLDSNIQAIKRIRERNLFLPIIVVGPRNLDYEIKSYQLRINIYHSKPIVCNLLKAQIAQLISFFSEKAVLELGNIKIDISSHSFFIHNKKVLFTFREFHLLLLLIMAEGRILSRGTINSHFPNSHKDISYAAIDTLISRIRSKLKGHIKKPLIKTEYKLGYRINPIYLEDYHVEKKRD